MEEKTISKGRKALLVKLESMIGDECYNANIQNWGPGGIFEGSGRHFRYPITFRDGKGEKVKGWRVDAAMPDAMMKGGYYAFGANELHVIYALSKILDLLESEYGLSIDSERD